MAKKSNLKVVELPEPDHQLILNEALNDEQSNLEKLIAERSEIRRNIITDPRGTIHQIRAIEEAIEQSKLIIQSYQDALDSVQEEMESDLMEMRLAESEADRSHTIKLAYERVDQAEMLDACINGLLTVMTSFRDSGNVNSAYAQRVITTLHRNSIDHTQDSIMMNVPLASGRSANIAAAFAVAMKKVADVLDSDYLKQYIQFTQDMPRTSTSIALAAQHDADILASRFKGAAK